MSGESLSVIRSRLKDILSRLSASKGSWLDATSLTSGGGQNDTF